MPLLSILHVSSWRSLRRPVSDCKLIFADEFCFFEKLNKTILGRECYETVFQPCDINLSPQKTTKSWRDVGIWKKARVNRHNDLCNPFPWMGNPFSLITHSFLRFIKLALFGLLFAIRENEVNPRERIAI